MGRESEREEKEKKGKRKSQRSIEVKKIPFHNKQAFSSTEGTLTSQCVLPYPPFFPRTQATRLVYYRCAMLTCPHFFVDRLVDELLAVI